MIVEYNRFVDNEYKDYKVYAALANVEKNGERKRALQKLAEVEKRHYEFWMQYTSGHRPKISTTYIRLLVFLRLLLGVTFVVKLLENHEKKTLMLYQQLSSSPDIGQQERDAINTVINEENDVEKKLLSNIDEAVVRYLGFIMLGFSDAVVELTGVQAGFLGVTDTTTIAGIAGLIVGVAASISMGAASYMQSRQGMSQKPIFSGLVTGMLYMLTVGALASPYFLIHDLATAFLAALSTSLTLLAFLTFYSAVLQERPFWSEYIHNVSILLAVAFGTFLLGKILAAYFGVENLLLP